MPGRCGGTPPRNTALIDGATYRGAPAINGCGNQTKRWVIARTPAPPGHRPTFARTLPITICPYCDTGHHNNPSP